MTATSMNLQFCLKLFNFGILQNDMLVFTLTCVYWASFSVKLCMYEIQMICEEFLFIAMPRQSILSFQVKLSRPIND